MGRNGKSLMGIPWEWELVTQLGMGMGRNVNRLHGMGGSGNVKSHSRASVVRTLDDFLCRCDVLSACC